MLEAIFSIATGLGLVFAAGWTLDLYRLDTDAVGEFMARNYGGLYLALGVLAWLVRGVTARDVLIPLVATYCLYHLALLVVALQAWIWGDFDFDLGWGSVALEACFAAAFGYFGVRLAFDSRPR